MRPQDMRTIIQKKVEGFVPRTGTELLLIFSDEIEADGISRFLNGRDAYWQTAEAKMDRFGLETKIEITLLQHEGTLEWLDSILDLLTSIAVVKL